jgi:ATP-dependent Clp protease protease subunit
MRYLVLNVLGFLFLGLVVLTPYQVLSGVNSANTKSITVLDKSNIIPSVSEEVVAANTYQVKTLNTDDAVVVQLNTEVTETTVDAAIAKIKEANTTKKNAIYLLLNSPGGSVFDGGRLITAMENSKLPVYTICVEGCYSMAAQILEHGKERYALNRATIMFHSATASFAIEGQIDNIFTRIEYAKKSIDKFDMYVAKRAGMPYDTFKLKVEKNMWIDSEDALEQHLIDAIVDIDFEKETVPTPLIGNKNYILDLKN